VQFQLKFSVDFGSATSVAPISFINSLCTAEAVLPGWECYAFPSGMMETRNSNCKNNLFLIKGTK